MLFQVKFFHCTVFFSLMCWAGLYLEIPNFDWLLVCTKGIKMRNF
jgi:hypothetical protein